MSVKDCFGSKKTKDPVCYMDVDTGKAEFRSNCQGRADPKRSYSIKPAVIRWV